MKLKAIDMNERMEHYKVAGVSMALIEHGIPGSELVFGVLESGTERKVHKDTLFNACSISKFAAAMLVITLTEQGILDLDENVNHRLTSWKVPENGMTGHHNVTLRTLLSHQAGFIDPEGSFSEYDPVQGWPSLVDLLEGRTPYCPEPARVAYEPGSQFQYSDTGFCIIEQLIEDVTGKPYEQVMTEIVFEPLHMNNSMLKSCIPENIRHLVACGHNKDGELTHDPYPVYPYRAAAGLWTTPGDLALLLTEFIQALDGSSRLGLSKAAVTEMLTPQGCSPWTGLGVFLDNPDGEIEISSLGWGVGFQCLLMAYPYRGTGVVIMTNTDPGVHQTKGLIGEIISAQ